MTPLGFKLESLIVQASVNVKLGKGWSSGEILKDKYLLYISMLQQGKKV